MCMHEHRDLPRVHVHIHTRFSLGFKRTRVASGFRFRVGGLGFRVQFFGFRVQFFGFRVQFFGLRARVEAYPCGLRRP